jgi:hypothetical protein
MPLGLLLSQYVPSQTGTCVALFRRKLKKGRSGVCFTFFLSHLTYVQDHGWSGFNLFNVCSVLLRRCVAFLMGDMTKDAREINGSFQTFPPPSLYLFVEAQTLTAWFASRRPGGRAMVLLTMTWGNLFTGPGVSFFFRLVFFCFFVILAVLAHTYSSNKSPPFDQKEEDILHRSQRWRT